MSGEDHLCLLGNALVHKMLGKNGDIGEQVVFSDFVVKINPRGREQTRVLMVTDQAAYNLMPNDYSKCKRRILLNAVGQITLSEVSDEFVMHVPEEYDYRFKSNKKEKIAEILGQQVKKLTGKKVKVMTSSLGQLKDVQVTKRQARLQTREEVMLRKAELAAEEHESDKEEEKQGPVVGQYALDSNVTVSLNDFQLLKVIGRGSFGKVMQVRKKDTGDIFAMKILKKSAIIARNQVEHTKAERDILQALNHPFLMTLRYAFQTQDKLYFVLDYLRGGELFFHLKNRRRFPEDIARIYVAEIALALGHLHSLDIIYRDLKPENILLDDEGHICLTDFGLSKDITPNQEQAHTFCGTPEYLAPEVVMGTGHGKAVDWWSLGVLLYELTVGIPPFYSQNVNEMYNKIQNAPLRFPPFLSAECRSLVTQLLDRKPETRLGSGPTDCEEVKAHPFFSGIDWQRLYDKGIPPGFKPNVDGTTDTSNFDNTFTDEPVVDSVLEESRLTNQDQANFEGFTYVPANKLQAPQ